jgi:2'-5' RNA ligase
MDGSAQPGSLENCYSLVAYLPEPLAGFIDQLRRELEPGSKARSHVTLLPPRPLRAGLDRAVEDIAGVVGAEFAFDVHLGKVEIFPASQVVHLSIREGSAKLIRLHRLLNRGACEHLETFYYHPHVTLAQGLPLERVRGAAETAEARWREFPGARHFPLEKLTLVQNVGGNEWRNLQEFALRTPVIAFAK